MNVREIETDILIAIRARLLRERLEPKELQKLYASLAKYFRSQAMQDHTPF